MTIRKPVVSQAAWVFASIASTTALGQTAPETSTEPVEVDPRLPWVDACALPAAPSVASVAAQATSPR
jgi:hypothetical protein